MKVGRSPDRDVERVRVARQAIGPDTELFVDANGALSRKQALVYAERFAEHDVRWFEEPVSSDDLEGLRLLRDRVPAGMEIAAGEYGYMLPYFERMLAAGAVDCLQADATRCEGITGFLRVAALCQARSLELSAHCGPSIHAHPCCAIGPLRHLEYFHDHARVEALLFDGTLEPTDGAASARSHPAGERSGTQTRRRRAATPPRRNPMTMMKLATHRPRARLRARMLAPERRGPSRGGRWLLGNSAGGTDAEDAGCCSGPERAAAGV